MQRDTHTAIEAAGLVADDVPPGSLTERAYRQLEELIVTHVALHGCAQDPKLFAQKSGYNDWAEHYRAIIVYPAIKAREPWPWDYLLGAEPNPLGCWDWWGYLDPGTGGDHYLTKDGPLRSGNLPVVARLSKF